MKQHFVAGHLLEDAHTDRGAPIYMTDKNGKLVSISGEGHSRMIRDIYESGGEPEAQYRAAIEQFAREHGIEIPAGVKNPVLIRVAQDTGGLSWEQLAKASNMDMKAAYTAAERSHADARELPGILDLLNANGSADIMDAANDAFLAAFNEAVGAGTFPQTSSHFLSPVLPKKIPCKRFFFETSGSRERFRGRDLAPRFAY